MSEEEKKVINSFDYTKLLHKDVGNGIYLTDTQINVLEQYQIPYDSCQNITELMYYIEDTLSVCDSEELNLLLDELAEFKYYNLTKK